MGAVESLDECLEGPLKKSKTKQHTICPALAPPKAKSGYRRSTGPRYKKTFGIVLS